MSAPTLPPMDAIKVAPAPRRGKDLDEYQANVEIWAREVERTIRLYEKILRELIALS